MDEFSAAILETILVERLGLTLATSLRVAYSGGIDSLVLLHALAALRRSAPWRISAIHIDHGLQPESADWARQCRRTCHGLKIDCVVERIDVSGVKEDGVEAAARRARYARLERLIAAGEALLTAHHRDDQAETLILQLLRGGGVQGLAAMPEVAPFGPGRLARPLLSFTRAALKRYAAGHALEWIEDASNEDTRLTRNFLRRRVFPLLVERWPEATGSMARSARHTAQAAEILDEVAVADLRACRSDQAATLDIAALLSLSPARLRNALRYWIRCQELPVPSTAQLEELLRRLRKSPRTRHARVAWPGVEVRRYRDRLTVVPTPAETHERAAAIDWSRHWDFAEPLYIAPVGVQLRARAAVGVGVALARVAGKRVEVRLRHGGERCRLSGRPRRPLKKLLQEAGVPPWERARLPLIFVDGELAAVADRWVCEPFAAGRGEPAWAFELEYRPASA